MFRFKRNPLDVPLEKLRDDYLKLDLQVREIENEISHIEKRIAQLFEEGKRAKTRSEEITIATRIKALSQRKQNLQAVHSQLNRQCMLLSNLIIIKESESILKSSPLYDKLKKMSFEDLEAVLTRFQLDAQNLDENLKLALSYTDQVLSVGYEEDEEIKRIMETMRAVREGELDPEKATRKMEEVKE